MNVYPIECDPSVLVKCVNCGRYICAKCDEEEYVNCESCNKIKCNSCAGDLICVKCEQRFCDDCIKAVGDGCECMMCPACALDSHDDCSKCGDLAVFCHECDTGNKEGTDQLCASCLEKKKEKRKRGNEEEHAPVKKFREEKK